MNLKKLYETEGMVALKSLAGKAGTDAKYLYQCASTSKMPSPKLAFRLCAADPRLVFEDLYQAARPATKRRKS